MKKLIILTSLIISGGLWANPMNDICYMSYDKELIKLGVKNSAENCKKNSILHASQLPSNVLTLVIAKYCRHDREIIYVKVPDLHDLMKTEDLNYNLSCVLYNSKPRTAK